MAEIDHQARVLSQAANCPAMAIGSLPVNQVSGSVSSRPTKPSTAKLLPLRSSRVTTLFSTIGVRFTPK